MPRLRAEQIQSLTLTNDQITDGYKYDANTNQIDSFDPMRLIDQAKIRGYEDQPLGWISRGIINKVESLPPWEGEFEGKLYYVNTSDELYLAIGTDPWYVLISGNTASGWDAELTTRMGTDGINWNGSIATQFQTLSYTFSPDGSDLFVYLNGNLQRLDHDYEIVDNRTIRTLRNLGDKDLVTMLVILSNSMLNYATKAWVYQQLNDGGIQHSLDAAYDDGGIVSVDNYNIELRLQEDNSFIISEAATGMPLPATHLGTVNMLNGHNWQSRWQSFDITVQIGGNVIGPNRVNLNAPTVNALEASTEISESLVTAGVSEIYAYSDNNYIGLQSRTVGSEISFTIETGSNALPAFGLAPATVTGSDSVSSYHEFGVNVDGSANAGLADNELYYFSVNGTEHSISTGVGTTYDQLRSLVDSAVDSAGFTATTEGTAPNQDIRVSNDIPGLANSTTLAGVSSAGSIEITQVTTTADSDRSLAGKYFTIDAIDAALWGDPTPYYVWYHMDAEAEVSTIEATAENSNSTLANSYFQLSDPSTDYFVWYEVETATSSGYQELGLTGVTGATSTGLDAGETYYFKATVDGGTEQEFNFTTNPDIQPTEEVTEVTTPADSSQSLSGKYWNLQSQAGTNYYVWYNIDTSAAPEIVDVTAVADTAQSLSGKAFTIFTPGSQYYAWMRMMTDPGLALQPEITEVTAAADTAQSLSGTHFTIDSADGAQYYVWYEMETSPEEAAVSEITEVTTVADSGASLSGKYFELSTKTSDYYVWYRMQTQAPVAGVPEETEVIIPADTSQSLSGTYWTFNTPLNDYYVWYRMTEVASQPAVAQETTAQFTSNNASDYWSPQMIKIYNFGDEYNIYFYDEFGVGGSPPAVPNPIGVALDAADTAADIATKTASAISSAGIPFSASASTDTVTIVNNNVGAQSNPPVGDTDITVNVSVAGTDFVPATYSTNPSPVGRTGVQVNILENDSNVDVATKTEAQLALLPDVGVTRNGATVTITNDDNGAVDNAADVDAGVFVTVTTQGVTSAPAQYSTDPSPVGRMGITVNISVGETANDVAALTSGVLNALPQFSSSAFNDVVTIENVTAGSVTDATAGDSGFSVSVTQQGSDFVPATYSTDPAPAGRSSIKTVISEGDDAIAVAEATRAAIDAQASFSAVRANQVVTITDATQGAVADAADVDTGFGISTTQPGQDYVAPTYTTDPALAGTGIQVNINENDSAILVATALESAFNATPGFSASRVNEVVTITNDSAGAASDPADVDTGFGISVTQQGYDAYSSTNPSPAGRIGIQVNIVEDDTSDLVAAKTQAAIQANVNFSATVASNVVTITDSNGGAVSDASDVDAGVTINVTNQGTDLIPGDVTWGTVISQLNAATSSPATWSLTGGDVRLTSDTQGSWTSISIAEGSSGNDLLLGLLGGGYSLDAPVAGTSSYSSQPSGTGTPIKVAVRKNALASTVASATAAAIDGVADFGAVAGINPGVNDHIVTVTNANAGAVSDIVDSGTGFNFTVVNQGANETLDPGVAGKTPIQININKNDTADAVAIATAAAVDVGGEFYVTRLNNVLSIQNDHPGAVPAGADANTGFAVTRTGTGVDPKQSLFGANGLGITLPAATPGLDSVPADTGVGTTSLVGGFNFYSDPRDFAVVINSEPVEEVFLDQTTFNSSELVSHINAKIADAGIANLEAYQAAGHIGFRTLTGGSDQTLQLRDSLSDAIATLGWTAGTYTGDLGGSDPIFQAQALSGNNEIAVKADILPTEDRTYNIGALDSKFNSIYAKSIHVDTNTIFFDDSDIEFKIGLGQRELKDSDGTAFVADSREWEANDIRFTRGDVPNPSTPEELLRAELAGKDFFLTAGHTARTGDNPNEYDVPAHKSNSGASKIGVRGLIGIIPKYDIDGVENTGNTTGLDSDLQTMMEALALQAGGSCKNFDDFNIWRTEKTGVDEETGSGDANQRAFFKNRTQVYVRDLEREIRLLKYDPQKAVEEGASAAEIANAESPVGPGFVGPGQWNSGESYEDWDWDWLWGRNRPLRGEDFHVTLEPLDQHGKPTSGSLATDSIKLSTNGGIELNTGSSFEVSVSNDLRIGGDLIVEGTTTTIDTTQLVVDDNVITLNRNVTGTPTEDSGIEIERGSSTNASLIWSEADDEFRAGLAGAEMAVALRGDSQDDGGVAIWNNATKAYDSSSNLDYNGSRLFVSGNIVGNTNQTDTYIDGFEKVYNAVWNDIADFLPIDENIDIEYGKVYVRTVDGQTRTSNSYNEQGIIGLASDTYGFGVGRKENWNGTQLPIAIGGFVLAHVIAEYTPGTPLTCGEDGVLVEMRIEEKRDYPERMVATYYKPESAEDWNGVAVNGRHWVKVK